MKHIDFHYHHAELFLHDGEIAKLMRYAHHAQDDLMSRMGPGNIMLGWLDLPVDYPKDEFARIKACAKRIQEDSEVLVVIGIGGSYLGSRAAISFLNHNFYHCLSKDKRSFPEIYFAGKDLSGTYLKQLMEAIGERDFSINVISKSGTTTEPAIAFRILKDKLIKKYGKADAAKRIYATTDKSRGALRNMADTEGYETFVIPDSVGGRFTVLTPVGLLPIAVSGADIDQLMKGAAAMRELCRTKNSIALQYAVLRNLMLRRGKSIEILANYEPNLHYFSEWWKQLMGESEGKDGKGLYPASVDYSTDLHSLGQFVQDGSKIMFETVLHVEKSMDTLTIMAEDQDVDGLNYLAGKSMDFVNQNAMRGTILAHVDGGVPNLMITIPEVNEFYLGELFYFFEYACAISGYLLGVNPFDQPGVEAYKRNMFALLGKPGYEKEKEALDQRLSQSI